MSLRRSAHQHRRAATAAAVTAAGALAAAVAAQRRHLRTVAGDEEYRQLSEPLGGRQLHITSADGTTIHAEGFGLGSGDMVVLAHGWTEQLSFWKPVIERLRADGLGVVAYDLRGHGRSAPAVDSDYSLDRFGEDMEAVVRTVADDAEDVIVAGHSLGAMSIAAWARHHDAADRARAAALINTGLGDLMASHLLLGELAKWLNHPWASRAFMGARLRVPPFSTPLQQAVVHYAAFGPGATRAQVAFYERMLIDCPADVRAAVGVALSDMDLWDAAERLTLPTLVITGQRDRLTPPALARRLVEELPQPLGLLELPDTGHMSPLERPREIGDALARLTHDTRTRRSPLGART